MASTNWRGEVKFFRVKLRYPDLPAGEDEIDYHYIPAQSIYHAAKVAFLRVKDERGIQGRHIRHLTVDVTSLAE